MKPRPSIKAPLLRGPPIVGSIMEFRRDPLGTLERGARDRGPIFRLAVGPERILFINDPRLIRHVLVDNARAYSRADNLEVRWLRELLGDGLLTTDGDVWLRLRRASKPAFTRSGVARIMDTIAASAASSIAQWQPSVAHGKEIDLFPELVALTSAIAYRAFFGAELTRAEALEVGRTLLAGQRYVMDRIRTPLPLPSFWPSRRRFRRGNLLIESLVCRALRQRLECERSGEPEDMLDVLLAFQHGPERAPLDAHELRDQIVTNFVAAPENMATALAWALYLLCRHPEVAIALRAEAKRGASLRDSPFSTADMQTTPSLVRRVLSETLRLYPGAPYFDRRAIEDDRVGGYDVPEGTLVMIAPYVLHRSPQYWPDPSTFHWDRFTDPAALDSPAYMPFGIGARRCIGERFAQCLLETVLPMLLTRFDFELAAEGEIAIQPMINLRPRGGLPMRLLPRPPHPQPERLCHRAGVQASTA